MGVDGAVREYILERRTYADARGASHHPTPPHHEERVLVQQIRLCIHSKFIADLRRQELFLAPARRIDYLKYLQALRK
jgi:hypothetical protein